MRSALATMLTLLTGCAGFATGRGDTVIYASGADLQSMNALVTTHPLARQVQRYVLLTTLVRYDSMLRPVPYLARSWSWSSDRTRLTFVLQPGVRWTDGVPTTAADAAWTITTALDPATGYPRLADLADVGSATALDDSTLVIRFRTARPTIPDVLTDLAILPAHLLDSVPHDALRGAAWNRHPVGNGPFVFVSHQPNRRWVFAANPQFPAALGGPPRLKRLVVAIVDEPTTKLAALTAGELDFAGIAPSDASFVDRDPQLQVLTYPILLTYAIVFNTRHPPFDAPAARRAVAAALDRRAIVDGYLFGFGTPIGAPVPPDSALRPDSAGPDPALAYRLLDGKPLAFDLLTVGSGDAALEQMIQSQLARAGIAVHIRQIELATFLDRVDGPQHDFEAAVMGIPGDLAMGQLARLLEISGLPPAGSTTERLQRIADSVPAAFLYRATGVQGMNRRVRGVRMDLRGELASIHQWWAGTP
jgi:peptide/nickel transport system substrate-binding protein